MGKPFDANGHTRMLIPDMPADCGAAPLPSPENENNLLPVDEKSPLLPFKARDSDLQCDAVGGSSTASAVYNLSTSIIGAGIMGLPAKMKVLGLPLGLLTLCGMGILTECSVKMLLRCSRASGLWSYADLMTRTRGRWGRAALRFCIIVNALGILIIYMIIIGDVLSGAGKGIEHHQGLLEEWAGGYHWWNSRTAVLVGTAVFVLSPLVVFERIDSLSHTSALSILLAVIFVFITVFVSTYNWVEGRIKFEEVHLLPRLDSWRAVAQLATIIPTMSTAYVCHYNVHPIYAELAQPRWEKMQKVSKATLLLCTSVYCITAFFGYILFGDSTMGDVLANYDSYLHMPYSRVIDDAVRLCYAVHLMMVFPVIHFSMRANLDAVIFPHAKPLTEDRFRYLSMTAALMIIVLLGATFVPNIEFAFQFTGSVAAVSLAFTLPGLAALSNRAGEVKGGERLLAWIMVLLGLLVSVTGVACNVLNTVMGW